MRLVKRLKIKFVSKWPVMGWVLTLAAILSIMAMSEPLPYGFTPEPIPVEPIEEAVATPTNAAVKSITPATVETMPAASAASPTGEPIALTPTNTPFPPEYATNREQTNGIILWTLFLLLIVILGTWFGIRRRGKET